MQIVRNLKVFISSAGDTILEREIAEEVVRSIDSVILDPLNIRLKILKWELITPNTHPVDISSVQDEINKDLDDCDIFILILNKTKGSPSKIKGKTHLEIEIDRALEILNKNKNIFFLTYFKENPKNTDPGNKEKSLEKLKKELHKKDIFYHNYKDEHFFRTSLTNHLYSILLNYRLLPEKVKALRKFWNLGLDNHENPTVAIIYPPVDKSFIKINSGAHYWKERLVPYVVFEDFKAMQKIEKTLSMVGNKNYNFYDVQNIPPNINEINRVWLCLPRNKLASIQLEKYREICKFKFEKFKKTETIIQWRRNTVSKKYFNIFSPLRKYLEIQRPDGNTEWTQGMSRIIAKDFAVIGRFNVVDRTHQSVNSKLKEYFIAGIRGLGTWGAGRFIDRDFSMFNQYPHDKDLQILLLITFENGRIANAVDVSDEPEEFFEKENDSGTILKNIKKFNGQIK